MQAMATLPAKPLMEVSWRLPVALWSKGKVMEEPVSEKSVTGMRAVTTWVSEAWMARACADANHVAVMGYVPAVRVLMV